MRTGGLDAEAGQENLATRALNMMRRRKGRGKVEHDEGAEDEDSLEAGAVWHVRGRLSNPFTGACVALVEGVELTKSLGSGTPAGQTAREIVTREGIQSYGSCVSNKFYALFDPETGKPLYSFRHTPIARRRKVQPFVAFSRILTHMLRPNGQLMVVSEGDDSDTPLSEGRESPESKGPAVVPVLAEAVHTECVEEGQAKGTRKGPLNVGKSRSRRVFNINFFISGRQAEGRGKQRRYWGNKWVGFGPAPPPDYGCKESYTYAGEGDSAVLTYNRYGECPAWYGPGKMCSLDVQAKRLPSYDLVPEHIRSLVAEVVPQLLQLDKSNAGKVKPPRLRSRDRFWKLWQPKYIE
ncbi:unnamed protein product [Chrysoparadoxa australica]